MVVSYTFKAADPKGAHACLYLDLAVSQPYGGKQRRLILSGDCDSGLFCKEIIKDGDVEVELVESMDLAEAWMLWDSHEFDPNCNGWTTRYGR